MIKFVKHMLILFLKHRNVVEQLLHLRDGLVLMTRLLVRIPIHIL